MISVEAEDGEELAEIRPQVKQELMLASPADTTGQMFGTRFTPV